jgi:hypothetical protein
VAYTDRGPGVGLWGLIVDLDDETGHASSVAGGLLSVEIDICAGGLDDANSRQGLAIVGFTRNYPTVTTSQFNNGISVWTGDAGASFKHLVSFGAPFSGAGIDFTQSTSIGNAPAIWLKTGQSISLDSGPFMQLKAGAGGTAEFQWLGVRVWGVDPNGIMAAASVGVGGTTGPCWTTGAAAPAATQPVGSIYSRVGGAVGATLYVSRGGGTWAAVAGV